MYKALWAYNNNNKAGKNFCLHAAYIPTVDGKQ